MSNISDKIQELQNLSGIFTGAGGDRIPPHGTTHTKTGADPIPSEIDGLSVDLDGMSVGQVIILDAQGNLVPGDPSGTLTTLQTAYDNGDGTITLNADDLDVTLANAKSIIFRDESSVQVFKISETGGNSKVEITSTIIELKDGNLSAAVPLSEAGETGLNTTKQSIIGAINELKQEIAGFGRRLFVQSNGTNEERGTDLLAVLATAKTLSPTADNPITIYGAGGNTYDIGSNTLNWDTDYIFFEGDLPAHRLTDSVDSTYANAIRPAGTTILSSNATATLTVDAICGFSNINFKNTGAAPCARINSASDTIYFDGCSGETTGTTYAIQKDALNLSTVVFSNSHFELGINAGAGNLLVDSGAYGGTSFSASLNQSVSLYNSIVKIGTGLSVANVFVCKGTKIKGAFDINLTTNFERIIDDSDIDCAQLQFSSSAPDDTIKITNSRINVSTVPIAAPGVLLNNFITSSASSGTGTILVPTAASTGADNIIISGNTINSGSETYSITASGTAAKPAVVNGNNCNKSLDLDADEYSGVNFVNGATISNLSVSDVNFPTLSTNDGDMTTLADLLKHKPGRGLVSGGQLSNGTNPLTQINVSAGYVWLSVNSEPGYDSGIMQFDAQTNLTVTPGFTNYVIAQWTASGVNIFVTLDPTPYLYVEDALIINLCFPDGDEIHKVNAELGWQSFNKLVNRRWIEEAEGQGNLFAKWIKGALIGSTGTRHMTVSEGVFWAGTNRQPSPAFDSNTGGDTMITFYRDGVGGFTKTTGVTQYDNTSYDNGTGTLAPLASNRYTNLWCYIDFNADNISYQYDTAQYTSLSLAQAATSPADRPKYISDFCVFIGRVVVQQGSDTVYPETAFLGGSVQTTPVTSHTQLSNLNTDPTIQHMTQAEKTQVANTTANGLQGPYDVDGGILLADGLGVTIDDIDAQTIFDVTSEDIAEVTTNIIQVGAANNTTVNLLGDAVNLNSRDFLPGTITLTANDQNADISATDPFELIVTGNFVNGSRDLPAANGANMYIGWKVTVDNTTTEFFHIYNSDKSKVVHIPPYCSITFTCKSTASAAGGWHWNYPTIDRRRGFELANEWYVDNSSSDDGPLPLYINANGTGARFWNNGYNNGMARLESGTDTNSYAFLYNSFAYNYFNNGAMAFYGGISFSALSNGTDNYRGFFGFNTTIDGTDGSDIIGLKTDYAAFSNDNSWRAVTRTGTGTINNIDTTVDPVTYGSTSLINSGQNLRVEVNSDGTRADFWINNTNVANTTTAVPTSNNSYLNLGILKTAGTNERSMGCDYVGLIRTFTTDRW